MRMMGESANGTRGDSMTRASRMHVAVGVTSLQDSKAFYARLFGQGPSLEAKDQIDWLLEEPAVHFSIFHNPDKPIGVEHIGIDFAEEALPKAQERMASLEPAIADPDGLRVEIYSKDQVRT